MTKIEKETIITFNEAEHSANLYTCSARLIRQMEEKILSVPEQFKLIRVYKDTDGKEYAREYLLASKLCVSIRRKQTISPERASVLRDTLLNRKERMKGESV